MASAAWERRNARARALGFRNYYDYRAHAYGLRSPTEPAAKGPALRRLRGHAAGGDLTRAMQAGRIDMVSVIQTGYDPPEFELNAVTTQGKTRIHTLRGRRAIDNFNRVIKDLGPDAPLLVGSPKALAALREAS